MIVSGSFSGDSVAFFRFYLDDNYHLLWLRCQSVIVSEWFGALNLSDDTATESGQWALIP